MLLTLFSGLDGLLEKIHQAEMDALNRRLAARMAGEIEEEQELAERINQLIKAQEMLRKMIRAIKKVLANIIANLKAMEMRRLHSSARQSPGDMYVTGMAIAMPVPPTL